MKWKVISAIAIAACLGVILYQRFNVAARGEETFTSLGCGGCHFSGGGPNLTHVVQRHDEALLLRFIQNPQNVYKERNGESLNPGYMHMPNLNASANDARLIVAYLKELDRQ